MLLNRGNLLNCFMILIAIKGADSSVTAVCYCAVITTENVGAGGTAGCYLYITLKMGMTSHLSPLVPDASVW